MKSTLQELTQYRNEAVINRFLETWHLSPEEGEDIFRETIKFLWLSAYIKESNKSPIRLSISQSIKLIDEMWHTFILFTNDYCDFCEQYFGYYLHHGPTSRSEYDQVISEYEKSPELIIEKNKELFSIQYSLIYELLGEETLVKWYSEYLEKYTDEFLQIIWRWSFSPYDSRVKNSIRLKSLARTSAN